MKSNKIRFKVISKNGKGVVLDFNKGGNKLIPWSLFNQVYVLEDDNYAALNEDNQKLADEVTEIAANACVYYIFYNSNDTPEDKKLSYLYLLGESIKKIQEKLDCSAIEAMQVISRNLNLIEESKSSTNNFSDYSLNNKDTNQPFPQATQSLSDVKGADKLKELFNK